MTISDAPAPDQERRVFQLQALYEIGRECPELASQDDILRVVLTVVMGAFGSVSGFAFVGAGTGTLDGFWARGLSNAASVKELARRYLQTDALQNDELWAAAAGMEVWMPFKVADAVHGAMGLGPRLLGDLYTTTDADLVRDIITNASPHLRNLRLRQQLTRSAAELRQRVTALELVNSIANASASVVSIPRLHQFVVNRIRKSFDAESVALATCDARGWTVVARDAVDAATKGLTDKTILARITATDHLPPDSHECVMPLRFGDRKHGALWLQRSKDGPPLDAGDAALLDAVANQLGLMLENDRLFEGVLREQREQFRLRGILEQFIAPNVADRMLSGETREELVPTRMTVTVLMADMRASTELATRLDPELLLSLMNEYLGEMIQVLFRYDGTIDRIEGDAIVALFGAPEQHRDDAARAISAASALQQAFAALRNAWEATGLLQTRIGLGVGIATGEVVAANIGSSRRLHYTTTGPAIHLAARLAAKAQGGITLVDDATWRAMNDGRAPGTRNGPRRVRHLRVKGFPSLIPVHSLGPPTVR